MEFGFLRKGQVSIEYVFIVMVSLIIILPVIYFAIMQMQTNISISQAEIACNKITSSADFILASGEGSKIRTTINLPEGIDPENSFIEGNEVNYRILTYQDGTDVFSISKGELIGTLPVSEGPHILFLEVIDGKVVINAP